MSNMGKISSKKLKIILSSSWLGESWLGLAYSIGNKPLIAANIKTSTISKNANNRKKQSLKKDDSAKIVSLLHYIQEQASKFRYANSNDSIKNNSKNLVNSSLVNSNDHYKNNILEHLKAHTTKNTINSPTILR